MPRPRTIPSVGLTATVLLGLFPAAGSGQSATPAELERLRKENQRLQAEIDRLKATKAAPPALAPPVPARIVKNEPGCVTNGGTTYCNGWAVTVYSVDRRTRTAAPVGRFIPKDASRISIDAHTEAFTFTSANLEYRGEGLFNAVATGEYSFVGTVNPRRYDTCEATLTVAGDDIVSLARRSLTGSGVKSLQPGLYPIAFRFACRFNTYSDGDTPPSAIGWRVLAPGESIPRPFLMKDGPVGSEIVHENK